MPKSHGDIVDDRRMRCVLLTVLAAALVGGCAELSHSRVSRWSQRDCGQVPPTSSSHLRKDGAAGTTRQAEVSAASAGSRRLTERQCVESALANHRRNDIAEYQIRVAEAQLKQVESSFWPQIGATLTYTHLDKDTSFRAGEVSGIKLPDNFIRIKSSGRHSGQGGC